jgi:hypothetical protein
MLASDAQRIEAENNPYSPGGLLVGHDAVQTDVFDKPWKDFTDFNAIIVRVVAEGPLPVDEPSGPTVPGARRRKDQTDPCPR